MEIHGERFLEAVTNTIFVVLVAAFTLIPLTLIVWAAWLSLS